mgnify:CR=1 FL=1
MKRLSFVAAACVFAVHLGAGATEVAYLTEPVRPSVQKVSSAGDTRAYRMDAARHIYAAYAPRIFKGRLPPLIHAIVVLEMTVDMNGQPRDIKVVRGPSHAPDVTAAVVEMIKRAGRCRRRAGSPVRCASPRSGSSTRTAGSSSTR